eukprot:scaffold88368_cov30-Prasinocladus_malaysianus.AAC.1
MDGWMDGWMDERVNEGRKEGGKEGGNYIIRLLIGDIGKVHRSPLTCWEGLSKAAAGWTVPCGMGLRAVSAGLGAIGAAPADAEAAR